MSGAASGDLCRQVEPYSTMENCELLAFDQQTPPYEEAV